VSSALALLNAYLKTQGFMNCEMDGESFIIPNETSYAEPHIRWCDERRLEPIPYPISCFLVWMQ